MQKKIIALTFIALMFLAVAASTVKAQNNVRYVPIGSSDTGAPRITSSPASCQLTITDSHASPMSPVWLLFAIDSTTFSGEGNIVIVGPQGSRSVAISSTNFLLASGKVLPTISGIAPNGDPYPGTVANSNQYQTASLASNLGSSAVYYTYVDVTTLLNGNALVYGTPQDVSVTVNSAVNFQILICALATDSAATPLDQQTPLSGSTLVLVTTPEISTLILIPTALGAGAIFMKRKQKAKS
jgi:hypothetical protein